MGELLKKNGEAEKPARAHNVILEGRQRMSISGVTDIDSFDESVVVLFCETGQMEIRGEGLHINRIDVDSGELSLEGTRVDSLCYAENRPNRGGLFSKLFR